MLLPMAMAVGSDPVHSAAFAVLKLMIGLTTPPVGVCLFSRASIARKSLSEISRAIWPFLPSNFVVLVPAIFIPW